MTSGSVHAVPGGYDRTADDLRAIATDNVVRKERLIQAHPEVSVTSPRENQTIEFIGVWTDGDGAVHELRHIDLGQLMNALEAAFR
jgi:hypothetical protein